jgi:hypothetical protein
MNLKLIITVLLIIIVIRCSKDSVNLTELLTSHQWDMAYYSIQNEKKTYYATEYKYRIQFREEGKIAVFKQSGDVEYGDWIVHDNKILDIQMDDEQVMSGKWELVEYYVWGYDQDRVRFKNNNLEIGLY